MQALLLLVLGAVAGQATINLPLLHRWQTRQDSLAIGTAIQLQIGTPPQAVEVLLDSGSSTLAVPGATTTGALPVCTGPDTLYFSHKCAVGSYTPAQSSTVSYYTSSGVCQTPIAGDKCGFSVQYGQAGSAPHGMQGELVTDTVAMGGQSNTMTLGAITLVQGAFQSSTSPSAGIFGVGPAGSNCLPATLDSWSQYNTPLTCAPDPMATFLSMSGLPNTLGLCMGSDSSSGVLTLGGTDPSFYSGTMQYTPLLTKTERQSDYYTVHITGLSINGQSMVSSASVLGPKNTIVDTGTPGFVLPPEAYQNLNNYAGACSTDDDCKVTISLSGMDLTVAGLQYCASDNYCYINKIDGAMPAVQQGDAGQTIIGYTVLREYYLELDRANERVGFASKKLCISACSEYFMEEACYTAGCTWENSACTGTPPTPKPTTTMASTVAAAATSQPTTSQPTTTVAVADLEVEHRDTTPVIELVIEVDEEADRSGNNGGNGGNGGNGSDSHASAALGVAVAAVVLLVAGAYIAFAKFSARAAAPRYQALHETAEA